MNLLPGLSCSQRSASTTSLFSPSRSMTPLTTGRWWAWVEESWVRRVRIILALVAAVVVHVVAAAFVVAAGFEHTGFVIL